MMQSVEIAPNPAAMSEQQRETVREQMNRLLESHQFKNSKRYPALLRFIVEETLAGRGEFLKERLLGMRVFDRPADYDTAADPIVRVTVAEIRKRIAQYYHDEDHDAEIRIELLPGHYAPEFRMRRENGVAVAEPGPELVIAAEPEPLVMAVVARGLGWQRRWTWLSVVGIAGLLVAGWFLVAWMRPSPTDELWAPILASKRPVLFCLPTGAGSGPPDQASLLGLPDQGNVKPPAPVMAAKKAGTTFLDHESLGENVVYSDMLATLNLANTLAAHHHDYAVRLNVFTTLEDLRHGPAILVGGLDNAWTMRALAPLRFHFTGSDEGGYWITDRKNPANKDWLLDLKQNYASVTRDYAIVARIHNEQTGEVEMVVAGIGMSGTAAAGDFLSNERRVQELRQRVGPALATADFEVVLSTDVVNGIAGAPKIVAVTTW